MRFANPGYFYLLIIAALALFYIWSFRARKAALERFSQKELLKELLSSCNSVMQKIKAALLVLGAFFCLLALLRPQWGYHWEELKRRGLDIVIALDTSKSMLTEDVLPSRLERSKLAIRDFVSNLKGDRLGLIGFAGSAFLECPLTVDYGGFLLSLEGVDTNTIPKGGTSVSSAIQEAIKSFSGGLQKNKILILVTDGEDLEGNALEAAEAAKKDAITIFCIGIGTGEGDLIFKVNDQGQREYIKDSAGNAVKSRLDEELLKKIALATGGSYVHAAPTEFGLNLLYQEKFSKMEKSESASTMNKRYEERFQIFLGIALLCLAVEQLISDRKEMP